LVSGAAGRARPPLPGRLEEVEATAADGTPLRTDLAVRPGRLAGSKFLYFPDENHWVLGPGNARAWYETVFAFLGQHVLGEPWHRPGLL
jgi:hypothetical protein